LGKAYEKDYLGELDVDGILIVKWISNWSVRMWNGFVWLRIRSEPGYLSIATACDLDY
jgi:hypothetical protein